MIALIRGNAKSLPLADGIVQTCVTSPPYFGLRDYGVDGQIGLELTPDAFVAQLVDVFREVRRVLKDDGTVWLNLGDSYAGSGKGQTPNGAADPKVRKTQGMKLDTLTASDVGLKPKDLIGIPWRVAFALQDDGWYLRQDIIWHKTACMPESVKDRCTKNHEYLFLLSKSRTYYFDAEAIKTPAKNQSEGRANKRSVWTIAPSNYKGAHFATFPPALIEPCILAGSRVGDTVLDPFSGSGTTAAVSKSLGRSAIGIELNANYLALATRRVADASYAPSLFVS